MTHELTEPHEVIADEAKKLVKEIVRKVPLAEREEYLHKRRKGYNKRGLMRRFSDIDDLKVPQVRERDFRPCIIPSRRKISVNFEDVLLTVYLLTT